MSESKKEVSLTMGVSFLSFLVISIFSFLNRKISTIKLSELLFIGAISFLIGFGVFIFFLIYFNNKKFNAASILVVVFPFLLFSFLGDVTIGYIVDAVDYQIIVYVLFISFVIVVLLGIIIYLV